MAASSPCPHPDNLRRLLQGNLPDEQAERLEQHLVECERCGQTAEALHVADTLADDLRAGAALARQADAALVTGLVQRLEGLRADQATDSTEAAAAAARERYDFLAPPEGPDEIGRLGGYRILKVLGAGGMGIVFQAEDLQLHRPVALKVMKPTLAATEPARQRFLREAQTAAAVEHDHVVAIHQVGEDRGVPFLAMPLLKGMSLEDYLRRHPAPGWRQVVRIARQIALGLAAAHERGLVHRDIKPGNVWIEPDHGGRVKLLDFGLARAVAGDSQLTSSGIIVGTPSYMAPEQARGGAVDHRCDLFSLGCVLYRMTTGRVPFPGKDALAVLSALASEQPPPPRELNPDVPAALSNLIVQLLAKDPNRRPASAQAAVEALDAVTQPEPPTQSVPAGKRRRLVVLVAAGLLLVLAGGVLLQPILIRIKDKDGKTVAEIQVPKDKTVEIVKDGTIIKVPGEEGKPTGANLPAPLPPLKGGEPLSLLALVARPAEIKGVRSWTIETRGHRYRAGYVTFSPDSRWLASGGDDGSIRIWEPGSGKLVRVLIGHEELVYLLAWSPDGKVLGSASRDGTIRLWDVQTGRLVRILRGHSDVVPFYGFAWSPDGKMLATTGGDKSNQEVRFWDISAGETMRVQKAGDPGGCLWSPDGKLLATGFHAKVVRLWDVSTGKVLYSLTPEGVTWNGAWFPDSRTLVLSGDFGLKFWDVKTGKVRRTLTAPLSREVFWLPDGKTLVSRVLEDSHRPVLRFWREDGDKPFRFIPLNNSDNLALSPDGKTFAYAGGGGTLHIAEVATGQVVQILPGHWGAAEAAYWSPDGRTLALFYGGSPTIWLWDTRAGKLLQVLPGVEVSQALAWSPDGRALAVGGSGWVRLCDAVSGRETRMLLGHKEYVGGLAWSPDGNVLVSASKDALCMWDASTGKLLHTGPGHDNTRWLAILLAWSADSRLLASRGIWSGESIRITEAASGRVLRNLKVPDFVSLHLPVGSRLIWSPDSKLLCIAGEDGKLRLWNAHTGERVDTLETTGKGWVRPVAWPAAGAPLVGFGEDKALFFWKTATGRLDRTVPLSVSGSAWKTAFSPHQRLLASIPAPTLVRIHDVEADRPVCTLVPLREDRYLIVSPDGHYHNPLAERHLVYVIQTDQGQETLTPEEFAAKYGWKNDPQRVRWK